MRVRRAMLYVPGDDQHKIQKALTLNVDSICMDIEDGVALNRKQAARETIVEALRSLQFGRSERLVRVNPVGSDLIEADLQAILPAHPDGLVIPKVQNCEQLHWVSQRVAQAEADNGWEPGGIAILALVETGQGVVNLREIVQCDPRLQALIFGAEDLAGDIGAVRTRAGWEIFYARSAVVTHANAFRLQALDMVFMDIHDTQELSSESVQAAQMGYVGKQVIHPSQVAPVQEAFSPTDEAIAQARRVVEEAEHHQQEGRGAFALDGKMVDAPVVKTAQWVLERARAAGKL